MTCQRHARDNDITNSSPKSLVTLMRVHYVGEQRLFGTGSRRLCLASPARACWGEMTGPMSITSRSAPDPMWSRWPW